MAKRFIHSDQFSKVFNEYNLFEKIATLKEPDENIYNGDSVFYVCDPSYGNWIYAQGHLYGYNSAYDPSIIEIRQTIEDDELIYAGLFNDIYKKLKDVSLIIPTKTSDLINDSSFIHQQMLIDDEIVIAAAFNQLHDYVEDVSARIVVYSAGDYIDINNGQISATYPIASSSSLGIIRVGDGLSIDDSGILSTSIFIPTKTSDLINDSSFVTEEKLLEDEAVIAGALNDLNDYIEDVSSHIPTKTSELINDSSFVTEEKLLEDEAVIAGALNDLNDYIEDVSSRIIIYTAGDYIDITNGIISATYTVATQSTNGLMSSEDKIKLDDLSNYILPIASSSTLGGVKVGDGLSIDDSGILSTSIFIPTKTSDLINDSSFVTEEKLLEDEAVIAGALNDLNDYIEDVSSHIPTKTSELINDSSFVTEEKLLEDEAVIAGALNDLNDYIEDVSSRIIIYTASNFIDITNGVISTTYTAGNYIDISSNGQISATYTVATQSTDGLMSSEDKIKLDDLSNYVLPVADSETLGGIKVGDGLAITDEGILSVSIFIPTKTSELINDSSFVTQEQLEEDELVIAGNINDLYDLIEDVSSRVPTKTSELINDSSFITQDQLEEDELVISAALNQLDTQIQDISTKTMSYVAGRDIDISNGVISVKLVNPSTLQEIVNNYESRLSILEGIIAEYEQRLQNLEINGIITDL